jgi:hypothetical protein
VNKKRQVYMYWQLKAAVCLAFFAFLTVKCEAQLGTPPIIAVQPVGCTVPKGGTITLTATAVSLTPMNFSWNANGHHLSDSWVSNTVVPLVGTVSTLTIKNSSMGNSGSYAMTVSNAVGAVTSDTVTVSVLGTLTPLSLTVVSNAPGKGFGFQVAGPAGSNFVVEASSDLNSWAPLFTNNFPGGGGGTVSYTDRTNLPCRFYRARLQ